MRNRRLVPFALAVAGVLPLRAQAANGNDRDIQDLLQLLNTPITVASKRASTLQTTPGVVTLITRKQILDSGARDLIDVLRMVPGIDFATDVQGVVSIGMRGIWGAEGKVLILWDGQELNETLFGEPDFGNHYPVDQIKQIEVIRGPGSCIYGGFAELGVIKITTLGPEDLKGRAQVSAMDGVTARGTLQQQISLAAGGGQTVKVSVSAFAGKGSRSDGIFTDSTGASYPMRGQSDLRPLFFDLGMAWQGLTFRYVGDRYATTQRDYFSQNSLRPYDLNFISDNLTLQYQWHVTGNLTLTPRFAYRRQFPWQTTDTQVDPVAGQEYFDIRALREKTGVDMDWEPGPQVSVLLGLERMQDKAHIMDTAFYPTATGGFNINGTPDVSFSTKAAYAQLQWSPSWANLTLGARWEDNDYAGRSFVPRAALTKVAGPWHFKVLYAKAFKEPTIENIDQNFDPSIPIVPEQTRTGEIEVGRQIGSGILTLNLFDTRLDHPIVYYTTSASVQGYSNFDHTGSRGLELTYHLQQKWGYLDASYSGYQAMNGVSRYDVPGTQASVLAFPTQKATLGAGIRLARHWHLGPSLVLLGRRYGYVYDAAAGGPALKAFNPTALVNANLAYEVRGLTLSAALMDAFNQAPSFIQAYDAQHSPIPGPSRELVLRARYRF